MTDVIAWPPVTIGARALAPNRPPRISFDQNRKPFLSQSQAPRERYEVEVLSKGADGDGSGYLFMLQELLHGVMPLVRIRPYPPLWWGLTRNLGGLRGATDLAWITDGVDLEWTTGGIDLNWTTGAPIDATATTDGAWDAIACTGFPPSTVVAFPSETVLAETGETARVMTRATSDATGAATIRLNGPIPTGGVRIGAMESKVMLIEEWPDMAAMGASPVSQTFQMSEAFESEHGSFTDVNPW